MPYKRSKRLPIQEKYAVAMVMLRLAGANEHVINQYRTMRPDNMKRFLPQIIEATRRLNVPHGWDKV